MFDFKYACSICDPSLKFACVVTYHSGALLLDAKFRAMNIRDAHVIATGVLKMDGDMHMSYTTLKLFLLSHAFCDL
jgi:hypothetical protein